MAFVTIWHLSLLPVFVLLNLYLLYYEIFCPKLQPVLYIKPIISVFIYVFLLPMISVLSFLFVCYLMPMISVLSFLQTVTNYVFFCQIFYFVTTLVICIFSIILQLYLNCKSILKFIVTIYNLFRANLQNTIFWAPVVYPSVFV